MAVNFSTTVASTPATSTFVNTAITVGGANPALIVKAALTDGTGTVTSVTWSQGGGTAVNVTSARDVDAYASIWAIPNPTAGAGTVKTGFSASLPFDCEVALWTGADPTTPCPDKSISTTHGATLTLTPANLTANDGTDSIACNTASGNWTSVAQNQRTLDNASNPGHIVGDSIGTTGISWVNDGGMSRTVYIAVRIQQAPGGVIPSTGAYQQEQSSTDRYQLEDASGVYLIEPWPPVSGVFLPPFIQGDYTGLGTPGRFFKDRLN